MSRSKKLIRAGRRWLYFGHRWTGIVLSLLFAIWFVSGVVMMYVPFPSLRGPERIANAPTLDWTRVKIAPGTALAALELSAFPKEMRLEMSGADPVYRFATTANRRAVSATTGKELTPVDARHAGVIAAALGHATPASITLVDHDQWVVTRTYAKMAPFWRVRLNDAAATDLYVARQTGEIVQNTTAHERFWNWLGAVPHWIYFSALRVHQEPWRQTVLWTSGIGLVGAIAGIWIGLLRVRVIKRYRSGSVSPYRGWMKWHHITGLIGGLFLVTWVFSGWLSMSPWGGIRDGGGEGVSARYAGDKPQLPAIDIGKLAHAAVGAREIGFAYLGGAPVMTVSDGANDKRLIDAATGVVFRPTSKDIQRIASAAMPGASLVSTERLDRYDYYWYDSNSPRSDSRPLPVLRLMFDNTDKTWLHIDPATGALLSQAGSGSRSYRWLFSALHSFDLPLLLTWQPLRQGLIWLLSLAGLTISLSGVVIGWRRLRPSRAPSAKP